MTKLIKLSETRYVVVDDSEMQEGCICLNLAHKAVVKPTDIQWAKENKQNLKVITHSTEPIDGDNVGACFIKVKQLTMEQVNEIIKDSVDYQLEDFELERKRVYLETGSLTACEILDRGISLGFKAHQGLVKDKLFTLEDMYKALNKLSDAYECGFSRLHDVDFQAADDIIKSLTPTEWEIDTTKIKL
jgi:hypothetical protein